MPVRYRLFLVEENNDSIIVEYYEKKQLEAFKIDPDEDIDLFECSERMVHRFNRTLEKGEAKRYAYKLEKVSVRVLGSQEYYGLGVSASMCKPEFLKKI